MVWPTIKTLNVIETAQYLQQTPLFWFLEIPADSVRLPWIVFCTALGILTSAVWCTERFAYSRWLTVVSLFAVLVIIAFPIPTLSSHAYLIVTLVMIGTAALPNLAHARAIITVPSLRTVRMVTAGTLVVRATAPIRIAVISALAIPAIIASSLWVKTRKTKVLLGLKGWEGHSQLAHMRVVDSISELIWISQRRDPYCF